MHDITKPLTLWRGSHQAGSGKGCAMNVISWMNGDKTITDFPECSDRMLARIVQGVNDSLAQKDGSLKPDDSMRVLDLGFATVGTSYHGLSDDELKVVYVKCAIFAARKVVHLNSYPRVEAAIQAAEVWAANPTATTARAAAYVGVAAAYAAYAADAADADDAAAAYVGVAAAYAAYAAADAANAAAVAAYAASAAGNGAADRQSLAAEIIALFKELTGLNEASCELPVPLETAVEKMVATV